MRRTFSLRLYLPIDLGIHTMYENLEPIFRSSHLQFRSEAGMLR